MRITRVPGRGGVVVPVCLAVVLGGCSDDPTGPVTEQPFDPAFAVEAAQDVLDALAVTELQAMMSNIHFTLQQASPEAGGPILPGAGGTYAFDEGELRWRIDANRPGAPTNGVRFVWYVMDTGANSPVRPLHERGWVDLTGVDDAEADAALDVSFMLMNGTVATEVSNYTITYRADVASGSFSVIAEGRAGAIEFDVDRSFTYSEVGGVYEAVVSFGGEAGLLAASIETAFDPTTETATEASRFVGSIVTQGHYLLIETDVDDEVGTLDGEVEADDRHVLDLLGTTITPVFRLPAGGGPDGDVQADMAEVWQALWAMLGDGVSLIAVLEGLVR